MVVSIRAEVMTIGDEILFGQITDTNTKWIGEQLTSIGLRPVRKTSVGDTFEDILTAISESLDRVDLLIITGGLGPTKDDITKQVLCGYFNTDLVINQDALDLITSFFTKRGREMSELNRQQAALPRNCTYLQNNWGTAPGMWFEHKQKVVVSLPGVPHEMKNLMTHQVLPKLKSYFSPSIIKHRIIRTVGMGESSLAERIEEWENTLMPHIKLAYLPHFGQVSLRLTGTGTEEAQLSSELEYEVQRVLPLIENNVFGFDEDQLEVVIGQLLVEKNASISTAESCTGGYIAHRITTIPGSSRYFKGSIVAYDNQLKMSTLGVNEQVLLDHGAVSEQTVIAMAEGIRKLMNTTYSIAASGVAGPDGGTQSKPVGTIWIACSSPTGTTARLLTLTNTRLVNIELTNTYALDFLRKRILEK